MDASASAWLAALADSYFFRGKVIDVVILGCLISDSCEWQSLSMHIYSRRK